MVEYDFLRLIDCAAVKFFEADGDGIGFDYLVFVEFVSGAVEYESFSFGAGYPSHSFEEL